MREILREILRDILREILRAILREPRLLSLIQRCLCGGEISHTLERSFTHALSLTHLGIQFSDERVDALPEKPELIEPIS